MTDTEPAATKWLPSSRPSPDHAVVMLLSGDTERLVVHRNGQWETLIGLPVNIPTFLWRFLTDEEIEVMEPQHQGTLDSMVAQLVKMKELKFKP